MAHPILGHGGQRLRAVGSWGFASRSGGSPERTSGGLILAQGGRSGRSGFGEEALESREVILRDGLALDFRVQFRVMEREVGRVWRKGKGSNQRKSNFSQIGRASCRERV